MSVLRSAVQDSVETLVRDLVDGALGGSGAQTATKHASSEPVFVGLSKSFPNLLGLSSFSPVKANPHLSTAPRTRRAAKSTSSAGDLAVRPGNSKVDRSASFTAQDFSHLRTGAEARQAAGGIVQPEPSPDADYRARRAVAVIEGRDPEAVKRTEPVASHPLPLPPEAQLAATGLNAKSILASFALTFGGRG